MRTTVKRTILLVEDNPGDAELVTEFLQLRTPQHEMVVATRLADALAVLRERPVDIVLLDLGLPDASGLACVDAVHASAPGTAIVVLTGRDDEELALACLQNGAQDYLSKNQLDAESMERAMAYALARVRELAERRRADALRQRLVAVVESSFDAILTWSLDAILTSWNPGAERIFGFSSEEAVGRNVAELIRPPTDADAADQRARLTDPRAFATGHASDLVRLRKDGTPVTVSVVTSPVLGADGALAGWASICRDVTEIRRRDAELRAQHALLVERDAQMRALTVRLNEIREEERTRISRAVHDELGQLLTALKMDLHWIGRKQGLPSTPTESVAARLTEATRLADTTIATVQQIALELRPSALDALGLPAAIRDEARRFEARVGVTVEVDVRCAPPPRVVATALFRIYQELMTNIARHASATVVRVALSESEQAWLLQVIDDGIGIPEPAQRRGSSLGLLGINERARALDGDVTVARRASATGTHAAVRIPKVKGDTHAERTHR